MASGFNLSNCPSNLTLSAAAGSTCASGTWIAPSASSTCGTPQVSSNFAPGHCFPLGTTTVTYTASLNGETKTCSFTVTVNAGGTTPDCNAISIVPGNGNITVTGLNAPIVMLQIFNNAWQTVANEIYYNSPGTKTISAPSTGQHYVKATLLSASWSTICIKDSYVTVSGGVNPVLPSININDVTVNENAGTAALQICISEASTSPVKVNYQTSNSSAQSGVDYTVSSGTTTIPAGQLCVTVIVPILDDNTYEPSEMFNVNLSSPNGATIADNLATVTITDNDQLGGGTPDCNAISILPGNGNITVTGLNAPIVMLQIFNNLWQTVTNEIYYGSPGTKTVIAPSTGQHYVKVTLLNASWGTICIKDNYVNVSSGGNPTLPTITISDVTITENGGTASLQICISQVSTSAVTVNFQTSNSSAQSGVDYTVLSGTATIPPGQLCDTVTVPILDDNASESSEMFNVNLSSPNGATIADNLGIVTIMDNDNASTGSDCSSITIMAGNGSITVANVGAAPVIWMQVFNSNWLKVFSGSLSTSEKTIPNLSSGQYFVKVEYISADWSSVICKKEQFVTINSALQSNNSDLTFNAFKEGMQANLKWISQSPKSIAYFMVERSVDGVNFISIGDVKSQNSAHETLSFVDNNPLEGDNHYRLTMIYADDSTKSSEIVVLHFANADEITLYPNPAAERVFVALGALDGTKVQVSLVNQLGIAVRDLELYVYSNTLQLDLEGIGNGLYFVHIQSENIRPVSKKLIVDTTK
jgi:hypothetical protein